MKITKRIFGAAAVVAIAAAGCSSSVCSQYYTASQTFSSKFATCFAQSFGLDGGVTLDAGCTETAAVNACNTALGSCSSQDQTLLQQQVDCVNALNGLSCAALLGDGGKPAACDGGILLFAQTSAACQAALNNVCGG